MISVAFYKSYKQHKTSALRKDVKTSNNRFYKLYPNGNSCYKTKDNLVFIFENVSVFNFTINGLNKVINHFDWPSCAFNSLENSKVPKN